MLRSSLQTSEYFSRLLGYFEGFIESYGKSTAKNSGESESWGSSGNQGTYSYQVSTSYNWANTTNLSLTQRLALLVSQLTGLPMPDVNGGRDNLVGYGWNGTTGLWKFIIQGGVSTINFMQRRLTGKYMKPAIRPKTHAELNPWTIEDLKRLNIKRTQAMMKAMSKV
jgi:hypothetical protein